MTKSRSTVAAPTLAGTIVWTVIIFTVAVVAWSARFYLKSPPPDAPRPAPTPAVVEQPVGLSPIELAAWRRRAWDKIAPRLDEADRAGEAAVAEKLAALDEFFLERRNGSQPFAQDVLSLKGKWKFVKSNLPFADEDGHVQYLSERFATRIFKPEELKQALESTLGGYLSRTAGIENRLLVDIRADLSDRALAVPGAPTIAATDEDLQKRFDEMLQKVADDVARDVPVTVALGTASLVGGEVAAQVAVRIGTAVATRLGISAGVLSAGASTSWATFGIGLVAAVAVDAAIEKVGKAAGYDPERAVTERVNGLLEQLNSMLRDGDPEAVAEYAKLLKLSKTDPDETVRRECRRAATAVEKSGRLGLRFEMLQWQRARADVRRETLRRMILEGET